MSISGCDFPSAYGPPRHNIPPLWADLFGSCLLERAESRVGCITPFSLLSLCSLTWWLKCWGSVLGSWFSTLRLLFSSLKISSLVFFFFTPCPRRDRSIFTFIVFLLERSSHAWAAFFSPLRDLPPGSPLQQYSLNSPVWVPSPPFLFISYCFPPLLRRSFPCPP